MTEKNFCHEIGELTFPRSKWQGGRGKSHLSLTPLQHGGGTSLT